MRCGNIAPRMEKKMDNEMEARAACDWLQWLLAYASVLPAKLRAFSKHKPC